MNRSWYLEKYVDLCYNTPKRITTITVYSIWRFITTDKILISIHRTAIIIWAIKIIRIAGAISSKQNCLRCKSLQRVGVERKGLLVAQKTPKTPVITGNSGFWRVSGNGAVQPPCNRESREKAVWLHRGDFNGSQWLTAKSRKTCINCYLSQFVLTTDWLFFYAKKFFGGTLKNGRVIPIT